MEGAHLQVAGLFRTHQTTDTLLHLPGRLIGKGQRQDIPGFHALLQKPGDLIRQHTGLARSCTGDHKTRPITVQHRLPLTLVQLL